MSNGINSRQTEKKSIYKLEAQRELYSLAKRIRMISFVFCVIIPLVLTIFSMNEKSNLFYVYILISSILLNVFDILKDRIINKAATIQLEFDLYVFNMEWLDIFGDRSNALSDIAKYSKKYEKRNKKQIDFWYNPDYDNYELKEGIFLCQKENVYWDKDIRNKYLILRLIIAITIMISIILEEVYFKRLLIETIKLFVMLITPLNYLIKSIISLYKDNEVCTNIKRIINSRKKELDISYLQTLQFFIQKHRTNNYLIPDWFNYFFEKKELNYINRINKSE